MKEFRNGIYHLTGVNMSESIFLPDVEYIHPKDYTTDPQVQALLEQGINSGEILLVQCPFCGQQTFYSGGFTSLCSWCGEDVASVSEESYLLENALWAEADEAYRSEDGEIEEAQE